MPRIPVHTLDDAPAGTGDTLASIAERTGKLLNIHAEMAHSPVVFAAYAGIGDAIAAHGTFDARTREAVALAVGNVDGCDYCQAAHTLSARKAGGQPVHQLLQPLRAHQTGRARRPRAACRGHRKDPMSDRRLPLPHCTLRGVR